MHNMMAEIRLLAGKDYFVGLQDVQGWFLLIIEGKTMFWFLTFTVDLRSYFFNSILRLM